MGQMRRMAAHLTQSGEGELKNGSENRSDIFLSTGLQNMKHGRICNTAFCVVLVVVAAASRRSFALRAPSSAAASDGNTRQQFFQNFISTRKNARTETTRKLAQEFFAPE